MTPQLVPARVTGMKLDQETDYSDPAHPTHDVATVTIAADGRGPFSSIVFLGTLQRDQPNPFYLGQRLTLRMDEAASRFPPAPPVLTPMDPERDEVSRMIAEGGPAGIDSDSCLNTTRLVGTGIDTFGAVR